jgi:hypothetical protein
MSSQLIQVANETLATNQRLREQADRLRARAVAVILEYRRHRFSPLTGASDASDGQEPTCAVCGRAIKTGDGRYRIGDAEYHPDCFKFWLVAPLGSVNEPVE